ncbi:hypothetical protein Bca101_051962 [Brassica carinata]
MDTCNKNAFSIFNGCLMMFLSLQLHEVSSDRISTNQSLSGYQTIVSSDSIKSKELDWEKRMNIIHGTTRGLQYLHEDSHLKIIHRDLKSMTISKGSLEHSKCLKKLSLCLYLHANNIVFFFSSREKGDGYMSPEYGWGGIISEKSDIYSFGVLLLEIISGKKANKFVHNDHNSLINYAWQSWCDTKGVSIVDEALDHPKDRPTISQIGYMFNNDYHLQYPKQPTFTNALNKDQRLMSHCAFSMNEATQTTMEGR